MTKTLDESSPVMVAALDLHRDGMTPLPIMPGGKRPSGDGGWQRRAFDDERAVVRCFGSAVVGSGLGVRLGSGLADVDLDSATARRVAPLLLPATPVTSGRRSSPSSHWWFRLTDRDEVEYMKFTNAAGESVVEVRADGGHQTVIPPSIHPSGESYEWTGARARLADAAEVEGQALVAAAASVALASILVDAWPGEGARNDAFMAVSGALLRGCHDDEGLVKATRRVVSAIARATGDEPKARVRETVSQTVRKLAEGHNVTGWTTLARLLSASDAEGVVESAKRAADALRGALGVVMNIVEVEDRPARASCPLYGSPGHDPFACPVCLVARRRAVAEAHRILEVERHEEFQRAVSGELGEREEAALLGRFTVHDADEVRARITEPDLVAGIVGPRGSLNQISGHRGTGKTLFTLGLAGAVAEGLSDFHGLAVTAHLPVLFVYREGIPGLPQRLRAWEEHHGRLMSGVTFLHDPLDMRDPADVQALTILARRQNCGLIVLDSVAKTGGGKEDIEDFSDYRTGLEALRDGTGAAVLVLHNSGYDKSRGRGHTTLVDGMDSSVVLRTRPDREGGGIDLVDEKSRETAPLESINLGIQPVAESVVMVRRDWTETLATAMQVADSTMSKVAAAIDGAETPGEATAEEVAAALGVSRTNLSRELRPLLESGQLLTNGKATTGRRYLLPTLVNGLDESEVDER